MKSTLISLLLLFISTSVLAKNLTLKKQKKIIDHIAKEVRKEYYITGHGEVVTGTPTVMTKKELVNFYFDLKSNPYPEETLTSKEVSSLFRCHYSKSCALWYFGSSAEYWGGFGTSEHFILLNIKNGKNKHISFVSYAE